MAEQQQGLFADVPISQPEVGRPRQYSDAESEGRRRQSALHQQARRQAAYRCIGEIPAPADPDRRRQALADFGEFRRLYHRDKFYLPDSPAHEELDAAIIEAIGSSVQDDPRAFAFPRGSGKTTRSVVALQWAVLSARKRFPLVVAANATKAKSLLKGLIDDFLHNQDLADDFPEISYPLACLEGNKSRRLGQTYAAGDQALPTEIEWTDELLVLPWIRGCAFSQHAIGAYGIRSNGLRGTQLLHKPSGAIMRPDLVILDDVQNDASAVSASQCTSIKRLIEAAVKFLRGPGHPVSIFMPCTILFEHDVADQYTDRKRKPRWRGLRVAMLAEMPSDLAAWQRYFDFRDRLYENEQDVAAIAEKLNHYYRAHQPALTAGAEASWEHNYDPGEVDAIQHAMHLYRDDEESFWSECQNQPQARAMSVRPLEPAELLAKTLPIERGICPPGSQWVVSFVDLHAEIFFWLTLAVGADFSGSIIDYGTWPPVAGRFLHKSQAARQKPLTRFFAREYPEEARGRGSFEARLYYGLTTLADELLAREYTIAGTATRLSHTRIGIDIRWGDATSVTKRFLRERREPRLIGCFGQYVGAASKPFADYQRTKGWLFETDLHPHLADARWILRTDNTGLRYLSVDANAAKTFLMRRLASPLGASGSIGLFAGTRDDHEMLCSHICLSESPLAKTAKGRTVEEWHVTPQRPDNDLLDCAAGCMALASWAGASLKSSGQSNSPRRRRVTMNELHQRAKSRRRRQ